MRKNDEHEDEWMEVSLNDFEKKIDLTEQLKNVDLEFLQNYCLDFMSELEKIQSELNNQKSKIETRIEQNSKPVLFSNEKFNSITQLQNAIQTCYEVAKDCFNNAYDLTQGDTPPDNKKPPTHESIVNDLSRGLTVLSNFTKQIKQNDSLNKHEGFSKVLNMIKEFIGVRTKTQKLVDAVGNVVEKRNPKKPK